MSYVSGDGKPRRKIVLFIVGIIIFFAALYVATDVANFVKLDILKYFRIIAIVGLIIQIIAIYKLRVYSKYYVFSFCAVILDLIIVTPYIVFLLMNDLNPTAYPWLPDALKACNIAEVVAETLIMVFFFVATDELAEQSFHGMGKLTVILIIVYVLLAAVEVTSGVLTWMGVVLPDGWYVDIILKIISVSTAIKAIGTIAFLICALIYIKD